MPTPEKQGRSRRRALIGGAICLGLVALLFLGGALPDVDGTFDAAQRRVCGIIFALLATCAGVCFHLAQGTSSRRLVVESAVMFAVFMGLGLMLNL